LPLSGSFIRSLRDWREPVDAALDCRAPSGLAMTGMNHAGEEGVDGPIKSGHDGL
jgi:hypothetical protein